MKAVIISGGNIKNDFALDFLRENSYDYLVGADKGIEFCRRNSIVPSAIVGDFDSTDPEALRFYEKQKIPVRYLLPEKDDTDTQSALDMVMEAGADEVILLGGTGDRIDHLWANVQLLYYSALHEVQLCMYDEKNYLSLWNKAFVIDREEQYGSYISFFAVGGEVENLTLEGFKYPLINHRVSVADGSLTVSNEIVEKVGKVTFSKGKLLMIQSRD